jgi:DnaK suppressor protein
MDSNTMASPASGLDREQLALLNARLEEERDTLTRRLKDRRERLLELANRQPDDADWAADSADQSLIARLVDRDAKLLGEVQRALRKIGNGSYGVCEQTGEPIGFDRLRARPWSRLSLVAKERVEREDTQEGPEVLGKHAPDDAA